MFSKEVPRIITRRRPNSGLGTTRQRYMRSETSPVKEREFVSEETLITTAADLEKEAQIQHKRRLMNLGTKGKIIVGIELAAGTLGADTIWAYERNSMYEFGANLCAIAVLQMITYVTSKIEFDNNQPPKK